ncbi:MAG TPA: hypothetical protein VIT23_05770 [Terrimicrobiaceae bacterium]
MTSHLTLGKARLSEEFLVDVGITALLEQIHKIVRTPFKFVRDVHSTSG